MLQEAKKREKTAATIMGAKFALAALSNPLTVSSSPEAQAGWAAAQRRRALIARVAKVNRRQTSSQTGPEPERKNRLPTIIRIPRKNRTEPEVRPIFKESKKTFGQFIEESFIAKSRIQMSIN